MEFKDIQISKNVAFTILVYILPTDPFRQKVLQSLNDFYCDLGKSIDLVHRELTDAGLENCVVKQKAHLN